MCAAVSALAIAAAGTSPAKAETRYSIAGGCFTLTSAQTGQAAPGAAEQRMQATDLGSYLLYGSSLDFLASLGGDAVGRAAQPSPAADWTVEDAADSSFTLSPASAPNQVLAVVGGVLKLVPEGSSGDTRFRFTPASGCADYPEAQLDVTGTPARGSSPYGEVRGFMDGHMHWMTFEYLGGNFHCGKPWDRYGIPYALPDCSSIEGPMGATAPMQNFLNYGNPAATHDTEQWPDFPQQANSNLTYEGTYYRWIERVWMDGLRLIVMPVNENRELCMLQANRRNPCDEMNTVFKGIDDIEEMQDYVDAQAGGPGKGFFRIVRDPVEARRVINEGKMAVVLEVEVSEPFGCLGGGDVSKPATCDQQDIDDGLQALYDRGVRSSLLLNKFDNPLTGVRFDSGPVGALINAANKDSYGSFWSAETCQPDSPTDNTIDGGVPGGFIASQITALGVGGTAPTYPPAPHCNTRGLTDLGAHTVEKMMDMGMIINPDHMSQKAVDSTLTLAEQRNYSGVISPHGWMDPRNWPRIWNLGGMAFPSASGSATNFVNEWHQLRPANTPYYFGWGYGADLGGLAHQPDPLAPGDPNAVTYPFTSIDGATVVDRQKSGTRTFDYPTEGVAHYGLYADWLEEVRKIGGPQIAEDMLRGPEAYLQMWQRASGIYPPGSSGDSPAGPGKANSGASCQRRRATFTRRGLGAIRVGLDSAALLQRAGEPLARARAWTYCVRGRANARATAVFDPGGKVALVASTAHGHTAFGVGPGADASRLDGIAEPAGHGLFTAPLGEARVAYLVRTGRVRAVAIGAGAASSRASLREYLGLALGAAALHRAVPLNRADPVTPANAVPLKLQQEAKDGEPFTFVCGLGISPTFAPAPASTVGTLGPVPPTAGGFHQAR
jgi:hypothetical protein